MKESIGTWCFYYVHHCFFVVWHKMCIDFLNDLQCVINTFGNDNERDTVVKENRDVVVALPCILMGLDLRSPYALSEASIHRSAGKKQFSTKQIIAWKIHQRFNSFPRFIFSRECLIKIE